MGRPPGGGARSASGSERGGKATGGGRLRQHRRRRARRGLVPARAGSSAAAVFPEVIMRATHGSASGNPWRSLTGSLLAALVLVAPTAAGEQRLRVLNGDYATSGVER